MGYARGFYNPFSGGELKNNQYRAMPTNEEASRFADQYVAATEFKPWHLVTAPAKGLDILAPSRWVGLMDDANDMGFSYLYDDRNPGFFIGNDPTKTIEDYEFMDYVFNPQYASEVIPKLPINEINLIRYPNTLGNWYGDTVNRRYIADLREWGNVMYDPRSSVENGFRKALDIDLKPEWRDE